MIAKPLPCKCGHRPIVHYEIIGQVWHFVDCVCGHDCGPSASTEPEAIAGWNRRASPWQTMETAPRDGTRVLCFAPPSSSEYLTARLRVDWWHEGGWWQMRPVQPYTHWRPLPAPPEKQL